MSTTDTPSELLERATMHEHLAATTDDGPARKMHLAMAAEYRRKAEQPSDQLGCATTGPMDRIVKMDLRMR